MKKFIFTILIAFIANSLSAQITWSNTIGNIIYKNCSGCHNVHGIAPFELMSYNDAYQNGDDIKDDAIAHIMPPWPPDPSYSHLAHERILTPQQISDITQWVDNGMPRGDSLLEPAAPVINTNTQITNPDLIVSAPVYQVNTPNGDVYRCFVVQTNLATDMYLTGIEALPGDRSVVHHILIYSDTTSVPSYFDALDPDPGYTNFGGTGSNDSKLIGVWVPGQDAYYAPTGMGIRLPAHTNIIMQIHYPGGIIGKVDSTKLYLKLSSTFHREIIIDSPLNHYNLDHHAQLIIPANTTKTFTAHYQVPVDISTLGVGPHMHLIGKSIMSYGITPANDTIPFVDIPEWDFHWQGIYSFPRVLKIPAGTVIYSSAYYDNTSANLDNPSSPPVLVHLGESTTDEMMLVYFAYTYYLPGDENIIIDSTLLNTGVEQIHSSIIQTPQLYDVSPNPAKNNISFQYYLPKNSDVNLSVFDTQGKIVKNISAKNSCGLVTNQMNISDFSSGVYYLTLTVDGIRKTKKIVKE